MKTLLKEAVGYAAASACALVVDFAILWALVYFLSLEYLVAATISFLSGSIVAYGLSANFAFRHHRLHNRDVELVGFVVIGTLGLAVNAAVIFVSVNYFGLHYLEGKLVATGFTFACNFFARRQILFAPRREALRDR